MNILRAVAISVFVTGVTLFAAGLFAWLRDDAVPVLPPEFDLATPALSPSPSPTALATAPSVAPSPTPAPYDGNVATLRLPALKVEAPVEAIGLVDGAQLDVPKNPHNVGWYDLEHYGKPGFVSNVVMSAHVDYWPDIVGPFKRLKDVQPGDQVVVVMDNGLEYTYRVFRYRRYPAATIPMGEIVWPTTRPEGAEWLTLITCGGDFVQTHESGSGEYLHRDVVVAERVR